MLVPNEVLWIASLNNAACEVRIFDRATACEAFIAQSANERTNCSCSSGHCGFQEGNNYPWVTSLIIERCDVKKAISFNFSDVLFVVIHFEHKFVAKIRYYAMKGERHISQSNPGGY